MNDNRVLGSVCCGCKFRGGIVHLCITTCSAPQSNKNHPEYEKYKDVLFKDGCPLKEYVEDNEFIYWN